MVMYRLTTISSRQENDAPMPHTPETRRIRLPAPGADSVKLLDASSMTQLHCRDSPAVSVARHATAPKEDCIEERAKAIKKTIHNSPVNGLSAVIKEHIPDALNEFGTNKRLYDLEMRLAAKHHELEDTRNHVNKLEKELAETKVSHGRALEKTTSDIQNLQKEIHQLKTAQAQTGNVKKDVGALQAMLNQHSTSCQQRAAGIEAKVLNGQKRAAKEMNVLRSVIAHSDEKAEKAVETGALVLSVLSSNRGQKRKLDDMS
ncbi:hypothetical protein FGADI_4575 [Fusarium gaditjirri]|uniref:Uncharacterized protein n=1 Tax=Fusarium gaditjirri TaxID=282569 RepID=A0A8H4WZG4_9HYPO|nr:hypothetical protein FGADI_4575 [Fusarium gaditjirri]